MEEKDGSRAAELEKELERVRQFYTKKIKDVEKKADAQVNRAGQGRQEDRHQRMDSHVREELTSFVIALCHRSVRCDVAVVVICHPGAVVQIRIRKKKRVL